MKRYVYITENNLENRQKYQFAKYEGQEFMEAYLESRESYVSFAASDVSDGNRFVRSACKMISKASADRILRSFEVRKRIYSEYNEKCIPTAPDDYLNFELYLDFAELMLLMYDETGNLKYLNALLKVDDTLLSIRHQMSNQQMGRLAAALSQETEYVRKLAVRTVGKVSENKNTKKTEPEKQEGYREKERRLSDTAMICADSARSRAYLQVLGRSKIYVGHCYIMCEHPKTMERQLLEYEEAIACSKKGYRSDEKYFHIDEPILYTLQKCGIPYTFICSEDINSEAVLTALSEASEEMMVYSGFGGQILKPELFRTGKKYIHAHAGMVPDFRGSTTIYYHMLETGSAAVSVMFLNEKLDEGDILGRYTFDMTDKEVDIDMVYEPYIRALALRSVLSRYTGREEIKRTKQPKEGNTYYIIHPVLKHIAIMSLRCPLDLEGVNSNSGKMEGRKTEVDAPERTGGC